MRKLLIAVVALAAAAPAGAGGFATAGISPLPTGDSLVWEPTVTIRAHGVTPVDGLQPVITIQNVDTGQIVRFPAEPAGAVGEYRARVEFPASGTWDYTVMDGYAGQVHTFKPVTVAPAGAPGAGGGGTTVSLPWTLGGAAAILAALALVVVAGRRGRSQGTAAPAAP